MGKARQRIVFGLLVAVLGIALFVVATAYAVDHGTRRWGVIPFGVFVFPVAPVLWHFIGERRRRAKLAAAKTPSKSTLTGYDRYWMRFAFIAFVTIGPMILHSHFGVFGSVYREAFWFWPKSTGPRDYQDVAKLLKRVPADAELVLVANQQEKDKPEGSVVAAWGNKQAMIAADASLKDKDKPLADQINELNQARDSFKWLPFDKVSEVSTSDKTIVVASEGWKSKVEPAGSGPSEELMAELRRAPADAIIVAAFTPKTKLTAADLDPAMIRHGVAWLTSGDEKLVLAGRMEMVDAAAATKIVAEIKDVLHGTTPAIPAKCRAPVDKILEHVDLTAEGAIVNARIEVPGEQVMALMFCAMK